MINELCFGQDEFQHIHTAVPRNQSKYIGLKLRAVRTKDTDLRVLSIDNNEYSCDNCQILKTET